MNQKIEVKSNDILYLFSDGYPDQFGGKQGKKLKYKALKELLLNQSEMTCSDQLKGCREYFETWKKISV